MSDMKSFTKAPLHTVSFLLLVTVSGPLWQTKSVVYGQTHFFNKILKSCTFPEYTQGIYKMQDPEYVPKFYDVAVRDPIRYKDVFIGPSFISKFGDCYEKYGYGYVVSLKKVGGYMCFRCIVVTVRTPNIVQVNTGSGDACYTDVAKAKKDCQNATLATAMNGIMLWRSENVQNQYCPLGGQANFTYSILGNLICPLSTTKPSTANNCDLGFQLDLSFRSCSFFQYNLSLQCLGSWQNNRQDGEVFFGVYNVEAKEFRCGLMKASASSSEGVVTAALSNDSSCHNMLESSTSGYEAFRFYIEPIRQRWPSTIPYCQFPPWFQGDWETVAVAGDTMSFYKQDNPSTMAIVYGKCVRVSGNTLQVYSKNHCDDEVGSQCITTRRRSDSVLEYSLAAPVASMQIFPHCSDEQLYKNSSWMALSKRQSNATVPCSLIGQFTSHPQVRRGSMFHNISTDCHRHYLFTYSKNVYGQSDLKEVTDYQCIASWKEDGYNFDYVKSARGNLKGCFASRYFNGLLYIAWTGRNCVRGIDFRSSINRFYDASMVLVKVADCDDALSGDNELRNGGKTNTTAKFTAGDVRQQLSPFWCLATVTVAAVSFRCSLY